MIYVFVNIFFQNIPMRSYFHRYKLHCSCPQCTDEAERPAEWLSSSAQESLGCLPGLLSDLLGWLSIQYYYWGLIVTNMFFGFPAYLWAEENVFFFLFAFQPSASMTLKKKKKNVSTSWAGLKAACLQRDMEPGPRPAKPWCSVLQTHFNNFSKWQVVYFHWNTWRCWINSTFPKLLNKWW